jgi:hypothetical protein
MAATGEKPMAVDIRSKRGDLAPPANIVGRRRGTPARTCRRDPSQDNPDAALDVTSLHR